MTLRQDTRNAIDLEFEGAKHDLIQLIENHPEPLPPSFHVQISLETNAIHYK